MNLCVAVQFDRVFAKGADMICKLSRSILPLVWVTLMLSPKPGLAAPPAIYNLGTLGGTFSYGIAVNGAGQVVGDSAISGNTAAHAFRYDGTPGSGGAMHDLGTLGGQNSTGSGINATGQIAGWSTFTGDTITHAFRYDGTPGSGGAMHDLGTLGGQHSFGHAVNDAGQVAGESFTAGDVDTRAFRYTGTPGSGGVMHDLGTLGGASSVGVGVNNAGQVAGTSETAEDVCTVVPVTCGEVALFHAFLYTGTPGSGGVMHDLGTLGGTHSAGQAVNDAGQVAGYSYVPSGIHAFLYTGTPGVDGAMHDLGTLGGTTSFATAVSNAGQVVGYSYLTGDTDWHAFLYTGTPGAGGRMTDLDAWLDANNPAEGAKWTLTDARGLSNTGWITGSGIYDPDGPGGVAPTERAYLLDASSLIVPEPSSLALLTIVATALVQRHRSRTTR